MQINNFTNAMEKPQAVVILTKTLIKNLKRSDNSRYPCLVSYSARNILPHDWKNVFSEISPASIGLGNYLHAGL